MWISSSPITFYWRDHPFPIEYCWLPCQVLVDCIQVGLFLASISIPLIYLSVLCQCHVILITIALQYSWRSGSVMPFILFFLRIALAICDSIWLDYLSYFHEKCHWNFNRTCIESVHPLFFLFFFLTFFVFSSSFSFWEPLCSMFFFLILFYLTLQYCIGFAIYQHESAQRYTCVPHPEPPPSSLPIHPSGSSQCTSPKHPVSCIEPGLATRFIYDIIHISMPFSQIIPPFPSPTESKRLFYTSVSLLLSCIQGYCYHLSKFHIYAAWFLYL